MPEFVRDVQQIRQRAIRNIEEGAITEAYHLDPKQSCAILNEALATEIVCVLRYMHHYFMATGVHAKSISDEFKEHADQEREHADEIAERIQQLGGKPDFNPATLVNRSVAHYIEGETLADMIREDLIAERVVIDVYNQMIHHFGEKDPTTRTLLEHILAEEEQHASDLADLLYIVEPSTGETMAEDPGVRPTQMEESIRDRAEEQYEEDRGAAPEMQETRRDYGRNARNVTRAQPANQGGSQQRGATEPRPVAQEVASMREFDRNQAKRGEKRMNQAQNQPRTKDLAERQNTEQFAGRGSVTAGDRRSPDTAEGEMRPSRAAGRTRPDAQLAPPAHEPGTVGRTRRQNDQIDRFEEPEEAGDGAMGGGTRAVRVTRPVRKNRAA